MKRTATDRVLTLIFALFVSCSLMVTGAFAEEGDAASQPTTGSIEVVADLTVEDEVDAEAASEDKGEDELEIPLAPEAEADLEPELEPAETKASAEESEPDLLAAGASDSKSGPTVRTIMMYICGSDLERTYSMATYNLEQILASSFSACGDVRFIVMTGGTSKWHLASDYLCDEEGKPLDSISTEYNQIWEAVGTDAAKNAGKLVLLDGDGISGDGDNARMSKDELMTDPATLQAFIDYCVDAYPADEYDLILWDHGAGPAGGYGRDDHSPISIDPTASSSMSFAQIIDALANNKVTEKGGRFGFIDFDACLMGSFECALAFADYAGCYIASPETEPAYGQVYTGWLNMVGEDARTDSYALGKRMVDDFVTFYDDPAGVGATQEGTLAVINNQRLLESDFVDALSDLVAILDAEASSPIAGEYAFYDEMRSAAGSISYGSQTGYDLGNLVSMLGVAEKEVDSDDVVDPSNRYTDVAKRVLAILGDSNVMYAGGSDGIGAASQVHLDNDGELVYDTLKTSGLYGAFPFAGSYGNPVKYASAMESVLPRVKGADRKDLLNSYINVVCKYTLVELMGTTVSGMVNEGTAREDITYESVKDSLTKATFTGGSLWNNAVPLMERLGGEGSVSPWLNEIVRQQAEEAVSADYVTAQTLKAPDGESIVVTIDNTRKRVIESVTENLVLDLPVAKQYLSEHPEISAILDLMPEYKEYAIGSRMATTFYDADAYASDDMASWLSEPKTKWEIAASEDKWYAIKDADGVVHVAYGDAGWDNNQILAVTTRPTEDGGDQVMFLSFRDLEGTGDYVLTEVYPIIDGSFGRPIAVAALDGEMSLMSTQIISLLGLKEYHIPMSRSSFTLSAANASSIELQYLPVNEIPDVADGQGITKTYVVRDIYGAEVDISEQVNNPSGTLTSIAFADVEPSVTYNGNVQWPTVTIDGKVLVKDVDYRIWSMEENDPQEVGEYELFLVGMGDYAAPLRATFTVLPAEDPEPSISYRCVAGDGSAWTKGGDVGLMLTFKRSANDEETFGRFQAIAVDGKVLKSSAYDVEAGSLVATLKPGFLDSLSTGSHTVAVKFDDGKATAAFSVADASDDITPGGKHSQPAEQNATGRPIPQTSDPTSRASIVVAMVLGIAVLVAGITLRYVYARRQ